MDKSTRIILPDVGHMLAPLSKTRVNIFERNTSNLTEKATTTLTLEVLMPSRANLLRLRCNPQSCMLLQKVRCKEEKVSKHQLCLHFDMSIAACYGRCNPPTHLARSIPVQRLNPSESRSPKTMLSISNIRRSIYCSQRRSYASHFVRQVPGQM